MGQEALVEGQEVGCGDTPTGQLLTCFVSAGIFYTAAILGPAVGYLLGGYFLDIYTEIHLR